MIKSSTHAQVIRSTGLKLRSIGVIKHQACRDVTTILNEASLLQNLRPPQAGCFRHGTPGYLIHGF